MKEYIAFSKALIVNICKNEAVIIDTAKNRVFEIDSNNIELFNKLYHGKSLDECNVEQDNEFVRKILEANLGTISASKPFNENYDLGNTLFDVESLISVQSLYIELPFDCSKKCTLCNTNVVFGCEKCQKTKAKSFEYNLESLKKFTCDNLSLVAGNIDTHLSELTKFLDYLQTLKPMCHKELVCNCNSIKKLKSIQSKYNLTLVLNVCLKDIDEDFIEQLNELDMKHLKLNYMMSYEEYRDKFNDIKIHNLPYTFSIIDCKEKIDFSSFSYTLEPIYINAVRRYYTCLLSKLYIRTDGVIVPCSGLYDIVLGKINNTDIKLQKNVIRKLWETTPVNIKGCRECAYNIICRECRAIDYQLENKLEEKVSCTHAGRL